MGTELDTAGRLVDALSKVSTLAKDNRQILRQVDVHVSITRSGRIAVNVVGDTPFEVRKAVVQALAEHAKAGRPELIWDGTYAANTDDWYIGTRAPQVCETCGRAL
nr:MAG: hypothetical protein DIU80_23895 [Chloroflexota bacterium]